MNRLVAYCLAALFLLGACGSGGGGFRPPPPVDDMGTGGPGLCVPACLIGAPEFKDCAPEGTCVRRTTGPEEYSYCYSNGVKAKIDDGFSTDVFEVYRNGTRCWSVQGTSSGSATTYVYRFSDGRTVKLVKEKPPAKHAVTCDGKTYQLDSTDPACTTELESISPWKILWDRGLQCSTGASCSVP